MSNKTSLIFSLADSFEYQPSDLNVFIELGHAALGTYHIAIFNKNVVSSILNIEYDNVVELNKFCSAYNIINKRGSVYGTLFSVDIRKVILNPKHLIIHNVETPVHDYNVYPYANEKSNLLFYKDSVDTVLVITSVPEENPFIVLDEKNG